MRLGRVDSGDDREFKMEGRGPTAPSFGIRNPVSTILSDTLLENSRGGYQRHWWVAATLAIRTCRWTMTPRSSMTVRPPGEAGTGAGASDGRVAGLPEPVRDRGADVLGRGLRGPDRLDGPDAAGLASRAGLPQLPVPFDVGIDEEGRTGPAVCPNCGEANLDRVPAVECGGDRVLVQKFLYDFRAPKRWEVAVFHYPGRPVAGLCEAGRRACRASRSGSIAATSTPTAGSSARRWTTSGRCGSWCTTAGTSRTTRAGSRAGSSGRAGDIGRGPPAGRGPTGDSCTGPGRPSGRATGSIYRHWDPDAAAGTVRSATSTPTTAATCRPTTRSPTWGSRPG